MKPPSGWTIAGFFLLTSGIAGLITTLTSANPDDAFIGALISSIGLILTAALVMILGWELGNKERLCKEHREEKWVADYAVKHYLSESMFREAQRERDRYIF